MLSSEETPPSLVDVVPPSIQQVVLEKLSWADFGNAACACTAWAEACKGVGEAGVWRSTFSCEDPAIVGRCKLDPELKALGLSYNP